MHPAPPLLSTQYSGHNNEGGETSGACCWVLSLDCEVTLYASHNAHTSLTIGYPPMPDTRLDLFTGTHERKIIMKRGTLKI